ncbi:MAG: polysaccharide pyruvyl transferase family protein, partial [Planctomycetes bacterium]|nr:polysaccharide pyruvyl transferase family protein [Planctomycetota bacterium]
AINSGLPLITFGTGVEDPVFYQNQQGRDEYNTLMADWAKLLNRQPFVFVRGPRTAALLAGYGLNNVRVIGDPALTICDPQTRRPRRRVGINLGCDGKMWGRQSELNASVNIAVQYLIDAGWDVEFISMEPADYPIGRAMAREIGSDRIHVTRCAKKPSAVLAQLAECDLVIGQRLHAIILGCGLGIPTIALEYRPKVADFMESVDMMPLSVRTDAVTHEGLIAMIDDVLARRETISKQLIERCDAFRQTQREAARLTLEYVESHLKCTPRNQ